MACAHQFHESDQPEYLRCEACGTYWTPFAPPAEAVYTPSYWTHEAGHSTLEEQVYNCETHEENGVSKNEYVLNLIDVPHRVYALDIGCAPGSLLGHIYRGSGFAYVDGIEVTNQWDEQIRLISGLPERPSLLDKSAVIPEDADALSLWHGVFPHYNAVLQPDWYSLITAIDVFEHSHQPEAFLAECARLLKPGGQLILMLPLVCGEQIPERMFNAREHVFLHSLRNMRAMLCDAGLELYKIGRWCAGHESLCARKPV